MANLVGSLRKGLLHRLDADHARLDEFLHSPAGLMVETICLQAFERKQPGSHLEERVWMEEFYRVAQHRGAEASGWKLRFLIYYHVGKALGEW